MSDSDHMERNEVAARFSSLPEYDQHKWVHAVAYARLLFEEKKRQQRFLINKKKQDYEWISYPTVQELMLLRGLDKEEAESLYNRSQGYKCASRLERIERRKFQEMLMGLTVEDDDELIFMKKELKSQQSDDVGASSEAKSNQTDEGASSEAKSNQTDEGACSITKINCYDDQGRKEMVEMVKSYQMKLEEMNQMLKKRKELEEGEGNPDNATQASD